MKRLLFLAVLVLEFLGVSACSKTTKPEPVTQAETGSSSNIQIASETSAADTEWYFTEFERLGFSTFRNYTAFPKLTFSDFSGTLYTIDDFAGKIVLFNIWATWCPPCKMEMPGIQKLHDAKVSENFIIVAVSTGENPRTVSEFLKETKYTFPVFLDPSSTLGAQLASRGIPTTYIINKKGRVLAGTIGARAYDGAEFIKLIERLSSE